MITCLPWLTTSSGSVALNKLQKKDLEERFSQTEELSEQSVSYGAHLMLAFLNPGKHTAHLHASIPKLEFTVDMDIEFIAKP